MTDFLPAAAAHVVRIVLVADPGVASEIAQELAAKLPQLLRRRVRADVDWRVTARTVPLVADEQLDVSSAADVVRPLLPEGDWEAGVLLTDLPRRVGLRPVSVEVSPADRIALVSLPALGSWRMRRRARRVVADVVGMLTRERADLAPSLEEAGRLEASGAGEDGLERFIVPGLRGHLSLVTGMVRTNRPWRLFATLSRALAGVFATAAFGLINNSTWPLSDSVVVSSLTSVVNVAQLMRRKDMGAVLVVADDQLRGLVADRERLVHRARYRFSPGRHQRCRAKRVHDGLGVTCPWTPVRDGPMQRQDGGESPANGELRPPREQRRISARPGRYHAGPCARTLHRHRRPGRRLPRHRDRPREAIRRTDPAETTKRKWQL
ncbi:hypothetical protein OH781_03820 [Streptomyces sp. NBC_01550]|uniref:hypothetical protein n=1 Tax=Streptomyces sp. NBC_01550 TaxID=2975875 RepID=UPI0038631F15